MHLFPKSIIKLSSMSGPRPKTSAMKQLIPMSKYLKYISGMLGQRSNAENSTTVQQKQCHSATKTVPQRNKTVPQCQLYEKVSPTFLSRRVRASTEPRWRLSPPSPTWPRPRRRNISRSAISVPPIFRPEATICWVSEELRDIPVSRSRQRTFSRHLSQKKEESWWSFQ